MPFKAGCFQDFHNDFDLFGKHYHKALNGSKLRLTISRVRQQKRHCWPIASAPERNPRC